jgi:hypothetical protein
MSAMHVSRTVRVAGTSQLVHCVMHWTRTACWSAEQGLPRTQKETPDWHITKWSV